MTVQSVHSSLSSLDVWRIMITVASGVRSQWMSHCILQPWTYVYRSSQSVTDADWSWAKHLSSSNYWHRASADDTGYSLTMLPVHSPARRHRLASCSSPRSCTSAQLLPFHSTSNESSSTSLQTAACYLQKTYCKPLLQNAAWTLDVIFPIAKGPVPVRPPLQDLRRPGIIKRSTQRGNILQYKNFVDILGVFPIVTARQAVFLTYTAYFAK